MHVTWLAICPLGLRAYNSCINHILIDTGNANFSVSLRALTVLGPLGILLVSKFVMIDLLRIRVAGSL